MTAKVPSTNFRFIPNKKDGTENGLSQQSLVYFTTFCQILPMKFNVTEELNYFCGSKWQSQSFTIQTNSRAFWFNVTNKIKKPFDLTVLQKPIYWRNLFQSSLKFAHPYLLLCLMCYWNVPSLFSVDICLFQPICWPLSFVKNWLKSVTQFLNGPFREIPQKLIIHYMGRRNGLPYRVEHTQELVRRSSRHPRNTLS